MRITHSYRYRIVVLLQLFPSAFNASYNLLLFIALAGLPHDIQNVDFIVPHKFKHYRVSQENQFNLKEFSQFFFNIF